MKQATFSTIDGEEVVCIVGIDGGDIDELKNWQGSFYDASRKPKHILIWNCRHLDGLVCIYKDVKNYHEIVSKFLSRDRNFSFVQLTILESQKSLFSKKVIFVVIKFLVILSMLAICLVFRGPAFGISWLCTVLSEQSLVEFLSLVLDRLR